MPTTREIMQGGYSHLLMQISDPDLCPLAAQAINPCEKCCREGTCPCDCGALTEEEKVKATLFWGSLMYCLEIGHCNGAKPAIKEAYKYMKNRMGPDAEMLLALAKCHDNSAYAYMRVCTEEVVDMHMGDNAKAAMAWEITRGIEKLWHMSTGAWPESTPVLGKRNQQPVGEYQRMLETWFTTTLVGDCNPWVAGFMDSSGTMTFVNAKPAWGARASRGQIVALKELQHLLVAAHKCGLPCNISRMVETLHEWAGVTLPEWAAEVIAAW